ncbi:hypothetical protein FOWG_00953 [Fusarium oxysporum f. sp. lycopersici MN25]|nr:hypothetical protein FOWG_00953 [Fusarium oxysporum f. sp. lycopersici MN25]
MRRVAALHSKDNEPEEEGVKTVPFAIDKLSNQWMRESGTVEYCALRADEEQNSSEGLEDWTRQPRPLSDKNAADSFWCKPLPKSPVFSVPRQPCIAPSPQPSYRIPVLTMPKNAKLEWLAEGKHKSGHANVIAELRAVHLPPLELCIQSEALDR